MLEDQRTGLVGNLSDRLDAVRLVTHTDPGEQLSTLARYCAAHKDCNVVGVHVFSFGGVSAAAAWMNGIIASRGG